MHVQTLSDRERSLIAQHASKELLHASEMFLTGRYEEAAEAFEQVARRCHSLVEEEE